MRGRIVLAALLCMGVAPSATDQAVLKVAEEWKAAYNAKDAAAVAALYTADAYLRFRARRGRWAAGDPGLLPAGYRCWGAHRQHSDSRQQPVGRTGVHGRDLEATNAGQKVRGRNVVVVRKVGGRWLLAAHDSVVADQP